MSAVEQGSAPVELSLERRGERVRIEVADAGEPSGSPASGVLEPAHRIVNDLVARWGVRGDAAHVWFELRVGGLAPCDGSNP